MKLFFEFSSLVAEYNLLPVVLFAFGFSIKKRRNKHAKGHHTILHDGYEFILIELFAHLAVALRIVTTTITWKAELFSNLPLIVSWCYFAYLVIIFVIWRSRHLDDVYEYIKPFKWIFYNLLVSWWARIFVLALYSNFILNGNKGLVSLIILCMLCAFTWVLFNKIVRQNVIKDSTLVRQLSIYIENMEWSHAEKLGLYLFKRLKNKEKKESLRLLADTVMGLSFTYNRGKSVLEGANEKGKNILEWYRKNRAVDEMDRNSIFKYILTFYCRIGTTDAKNRCYSLIDMEAAIEHRYPLKQFVSNNECDKIVNYEI